jgi:hypothetical protein
MVKDGLVERARIKTQGRRRFQIVGLAAVALAVAAGRGRNGLPLPVKLGLGVDPSRLALPIVRRFAQ